jgi:hypothetical protein
MVRIIVALLCAAFIWAAPAVAGVWGAKSKHCAAYSARLAQLEAQPDPPPKRLRNLREWVNNRCVALNEMQVVGSHNSYHVQPRPALLAELLTISPIFQAWEFTHLALDQQFATQNVRQIELDVFADPVGGLYARRGGLLAIGEDPNSNLPILDQPGFKVLHIQDLDFETTCHTLVQCLQTVKAWSDANRDHLPIMILIETKDDVIPDPLNLDFAIPVPIGAAELDALDAEIRSVFPKRQLITPDRVRRGRVTLEDSVLNLGWPRLGVCSPSTTAAPSATPTSPAIRHCAIA